MLVVLEKMKIIRHIIKILPNWLLEEINALSIEQLDKRSLAVLKDDNKFSIIMHEARLWLKELYFEDVHKDEIDDISDAKILTSIEKHYEGGLFAFLKSIEGIN